MQQTLVLIKPDAVRRGLRGRILTRIEDSGYEILAIGVFDDLEMIEEHYADHEGQGYYSYLVSSMAGPLVALIVQHESQPDETVSLMRSLIGPYRNRIAGTIRHEFALNDTENSIHASDSSASAERECRIWFPDFNPEHSIDSCSTSRPATRSDGSNCS